MKLLIQLILWLWDISPVGYVLKHRELKREYDTLHRLHCRLYTDLQDLHYWFNEKDHPEIVLSTGWLLRRQAMRISGTTPAFNEFDFLDGIDIDSLRAFINEKSDWTTEGSEVTHSLTDKIKARRKFHNSIKAMVNGGTA